MPLSKQFYGVKGDECQCGRRASIRHCPSCGSTRVYARLNRVHTYHDGTMREVKVEFRCQGCGHLFVDEEREFCEAPPVGMLLATQKVKALHDAAQAGETLTPAERIAAKSLLGALNPDSKEGQPTTLSLSEEERNKLVTELRRAHLHQLLAYNAKQRPDHPGSVEEFVENGIKQFEQDWIKASRA